MRCHETDYEIIGSDSVWLQGLPFSRMADRVIADSHSGGKGEGSVRGGIGNLPDGD